MRKLENDGDKVHRTLLLLLVAGSDGGIVFHYFSWVGEELLGQNKESS